MEFYFPPQKSGYFAVGKWSRDTKSDFFLGGGHKLANGICVRFSIFWLGAATLLNGDEVI